MLPCLWVTLPEVLASRSTAFICPPWVQIPPLSYACSPLPDPLLHLLLPPSMPDFVGSHMGSVAAMCLIRLAPCPASFELPQLESLSQMPCKKVWGRMSKLQRAGEEPGAGRAEGHERAAGVLRRGRHGALPRGRALHVHQHRVGPDRALRGHQRHLHPPDGERLQHLALQRHSPLQVTSHNSRTHALFHTSILSQRSPGSHGCR